MDKTEARITLALDAMGSDQGPEEVLAGVSLAIDLAPRNTEFHLFGKEDILNPIMEQFPNLMNGQAQVHHAPEIVEMDEKPIAGIKGKKKSIHVNRSPVFEGGDCRCIAQSEIPDV